MARIVLKIVLFAGFFGGLIWGFCSVGHDRAFRHSRSHKDFERHVAQLCATAALSVADGQHAQPRTPSPSPGAPDE